jgi:hypothetical protein
MAERDEERRKELGDELGQQADYGRALLDEIESQRKSADSEGRHFTAPTKEQLRKKLRSARSPFITYQSWSGKAPTDGTLSYTVGVTNPDPDPWIWLFVHLFVGGANVAPDVSEAITAVDVRFPQLTMPEFAGLTIQPATTDSLSFEIPIPGVEPSNYMGNSFLFQGTWHDPALYLDRSLFVFEVTP